VLKFSPGTLVSSTIKTDRHNIPEILFKSGFKHINPKFAKKKNVDTPRRFFFNSEVLKTNF
jgi:hypothetical protein